MGMHTRHILVLLAHLGFFIIYALRFNLSVALVGMVAHPEDDGKTNHTKINQTSKNHTHRNQQGKFHWDRELQGLILSSFFYGYLITNIPGGWLASKYGGKWVLSIGILWTCILTLLTPVAATASPYLLVALRVLMGLGEGVTFPAMHAMIAKWAPPNERSRFVVFSYSGATSGTVITLPIASLLADSNFLGGWPSAFYVFGIVGIVWFVVWTKMVSSSPEDHKTISETEKLFILESQGSSMAMEKGTATPWFEILTSVRVWAIIIAHFSHNWIWYLVLTDLPSYFKDALDFDLKENGLLSSLPFVVGFLGYIGSGILADFLIKRFHSVTRTRRLMGIIAFYPGAAFLVLAGYSPPGDHVAPVIFMIVAVGFLCLNNAGYNTNHLDIAPRYGGVVLGLTNTAGTVSGCLTPLVTGFFTKAHPSRENYQKVFLCAGGVALVGGTFYNIFVTGKQQSWNDSTIQQRNKVGTTETVFTNQIPDNNHYNVDDADEVVLVQ